MLSMFSICYDALFGLRSELVEFFVYGQATCGAEIFALPGFFVKLSLNLYGDV
jgi:hypothetical protein